MANSGGSGKKSLPARRTPKTEIVEQKKEPTGLGSFLKQFRFGLFVDPEEGRVQFEANEKDGDGGLSIAIKGRGSSSKKQVKKKK